MSLYVTFLDPFYGASLLEAALLFEHRDLELLDAFPDRVINLHPALLPSFKGAHGIQDAFDAGVKVTGVTVHLANAEYDKGPIIAQRPVVIEEDDTVETLEAKIHAVEHVLYPEVLRIIADGRMAVGEDRKVHIR